MSSSRVDLREKSFGPGNFSMSGILFPSFSMCRFDLAIESRSRGCTAMKSGRLVGIRAVVM